MLLRVSYYVAKKMNKTVRFFIFLFFFLYPILVFWGYKNIQQDNVTAAIILFLFLRILFFRQSKNPIQKILNFVSAAMIVAIIISREFIVRYDFTLYYPVLVNYSLMFVFFTSLRKKNTPVIELLARITDKNLSEKAISYTRNVTIIWCVFFFLNGAIALFTCLSQNIDLWAFYNAFLSYIFIGALIGGEFVFRYFYKKRWNDNARW